MKTDNSTHEYLIRLKESESRMNTHEVRVSLETAKILQKAGFDWECEYAILPTTEMGDKAYRYHQGSSHNYNNKEDYPYEIYSAPTLEVAKRWLREVKEWEAQVAYGFDEDGHKTYVTECGNPKGDLENYIVHFSTYEEAQEACIQKCLTILLEEKK